MLEHLPNGCVACATLNGAYAGGIFIAAPPSNSAMVST
jgi:hypothetical protein